MSSAEESERRLRAAMRLQCTLGRGARWGFRGRDVPRGLGCRAARKDLWVETTCESVLLESIERGVRTFLFSSDEGEVADRRGWVASCLDRSTASTLPTAEIEDLNLLFSTGDGIRTESGAHFASSCTLETPEDTTRLSQSLGASSAGDLFVVHFHSSSKVSLSQSSPPLASSRTTDILPQTRKGR